MDEPKNNFSSPGSSPEVILLHTYNFPLPRRGFERPEAPYSPEPGVIVKPSEPGMLIETQYPYLTGSPLDRAWIREMERHGEDMTRERAAINYPREDPNP